MSRVGRNVREYQIPFNGHYTGKKTVGQFDISTKTFTEGAGGYRDKLAEATARGVCKWLGITYQEKEEAPVEKPWYTDAQKWAVKMGIADGTRPTDHCTRAEEWTMLQRLYNLIKEGK